MNGSLLGKGGATEDVCEGDVFAVIEGRNVLVLALLAFCVDKTFMLEAGVCDVCLLSRWIDGR